MPPYYSANEIAMSEQRHSIPAREIALLLLLGTLWGLPFALTKLSLETIPPVTLTAARVSLAATVLWTCVILLKRKIPRQPKFLLRLFIQAGVGCIIPYTFIAFGQRTVDSGLTAILNSTTPLFVYLISVLWTHHERTTFGRLSGAVVGVGGVVLVVGTSALIGMRGQSVGQTAILLATFSSALSVIHGRRFTEVAPEVVAAGTLTCAALVLIPASLLVDKPWHIMPSFRSLTALAANAAFATAFGFVLYFRLIRTVGSMSTASTSYLKPAVSVIIGCALLSEPFTWTLAIGLTAVLFGVGAINDVLVVPSLSGALGYWPKRLRRTNAEPEHTLAITEAH
jgi:drug/metabolite transporter (DMT)-like permease